MSFPAPFLARVEALLPPAEREPFLHWCTAPLPKSFRLTQRAAYAAPPAAWHAQQTLLPRTHLLPRPATAAEKVRLGNTLEHFSGEVYSATLSSLLDVYALGDIRGWKVLDLCAAPGSKTTLLSQMVGPEGLVVANEPSSSRLQKLASNIERLGCQNVILTQWNGAKLRQYTESEFDLVLVDAPCSSEGHGRKDSSFFSQMWSERSILTAARLQQQLIEEALLALRVGGILHYSTCTTAPEENECIVAGLLARYPGAVTVLPPHLPAGLPHAKGVTQWQGQGIPPEVSEHYTRLYPHLRSEMWDSECFGMITLQKTAPTTSRAEKQTSLHPPQLLKKQEKARIITQLYKRFGIPKEALRPYSLLQTPQGVWLTTALGAGFLRRSIVNRPGMPLLDANNHLTHSAAMALGALATAQLYPLTDAQYGRWLQGYDLLDVALPWPDSSEVLVHYRGRCVGLGRVMEGGKKLKNKLPRTLTLAQPVTYEGDS
ncbi:hypothetical protein H6771_00650 [Candidatus Peribacteria bacterium]|nr:hypothetical protein [Candidatus Peribacteria bacterium]